MRVVALCAVAMLMATFASASVEFVQEFEQFKVKYGRRYASASEEAHRFKTFCDNMRKARELQVVNPKATFGVNDFADMTLAEFKKRSSGSEFYARAAKQAKQFKTVEVTPEQIAAAGTSQDWRPKGAVTAVKNQGQCGSCWSFSTTGGIEGQWFLAGNTLTSLSEQELVSCDTIDQGCNGGLMDNAFQWLLTTHNGSIVTEDSYPYVSGGGNVPACSMTGTKFGAQISGFNNVPGNETTMGAWVYANGPLSIAVYAIPWQTYTGGILTNCPAQQMDHGVLIVGFDDNNNPPYWIIKNSWGASWGENGYIRVEKGTGQCSIGQYQTSSTVKKAGPTPAPAPTPAPGPGPNPTPAPGPTPPATGSFVQKTCTDATCSKCDTQEFPTGNCIKRAHSSYIATCSSNALIVQEFTSNDCSGASKTVSEPLDVCAIVFGTFDTESFVQVSCKATPPGPGPQPPAPTPPAPTPAPPTATFTQKQCQDAACTVGCQSQTFNQNTCLSLTGGGSAVAVCTPTALQMTIYPSSSDCTGESEVSPQPINTCQQDQSGSYFEDICSGSSTAAVEIAAKKLFAKRR